jgi:hypothetical protein
MRAKIRQIITRNGNRALHCGSFYCKAMSIDKRAKSHLDDLFALLYAIF